ncbi:calcium-binding protein [Solwaraspora sp. WMMD1047]|uniref:calcium-binding protein n=1 Tax=Solwaraspora sp. WMMD1047 TaxID=3016102 RepID=UPI0024175668|nr:calcium-binding protein [Solwaraspora sp. WMMD1047]MDG4831499.1 calcium-binding protein [Solwaraspora sp. WMMD1047]
MPSGLRRIAVGVAAALAAAGGQGLAAAPAYAAAAPGTAEVVDGELLFTAGPGVDNQVEFFFHVVTLRWHVRDHAAPVVPGPGCAQATSAHEVSCVGVTTVQATTLDGDDTLGVREKPAPTAAGHRAAAAVPPKTPTLNTVPMALFGGSGNDKLTGGWSDDLLDGGPGSDVLLDWAGTDTVSYADRRRPVRADPDGVVGDDGEAGEGDTIDSTVENVIGGAGDDLLVGNAGPNRLVGGAGDDEIHGLAGADRLSGEAGYDTLIGGKDRDLCLVGTDGGRVTGCEGGDAAT